MKTNLHLKNAIMEVVDNQLKSNDPPETCQTYDRLISEGYSKKEAKESATTSRTGGLRRAPERGHRSIRNQTPSVVYQLFPGHECILELFSRPSLLY